MISRLLRAPGRLARSFEPGRALSVTVVATALVLAGCGDKKDKPATQTAAKVNKEEITIHQINYMLQQQRGLAPEQAASASKVVLERLIDQEVALQKAQDQKLDRDPRVVQQLEAARREIIARAYVEKISSGAPKPSDAEIKTYYEAHPALFKNRRVYNLQELAIQATPEQVPALQAKLKAAKDIGEFVTYLKENDYRYGVNQAVRGAEQLPLASVDRFAEMKDGQAMLTPTPTGVQVVLLAGSRVQPIDEAKAAPAIEQYLLNERKRKVVADDLKALRAAVKIEYVGDFAKGGSKEMAAPADLATETPPLMSVAPPLPAASIPSAAPQLEVEPITSEPASAPTKGTLEKGMKGFK